MNAVVSDLLIRIFGAPDAALIFALCIAGLALALVVLTHVRGYAPMRAALSQRVDALGNLRGERAAVQRAFAERLDGVDAQFGPASGAPMPLVLGWRRFMNGLIPLADGRLGARAEAGEAFDRLDESAQALEWWANTLIAIGLVITFLGIVAALTQATAAFRAGGGAVQVQAAIVGLLAVAATKFWTSIAGVLSATVLRFIARGRRRTIAQLELALFNVLDRCVERTAADPVALRQLEALERIEALLGAPAAQRLAS